MKDEKIGNRKEPFVACYKVAYGNHGVERENHESWQFGFDADVVPP
jgi:hypothetical protein